MSVNRRSFIRYSALAAAGNVIGLLPFAALNAAAQTGSPTSGYKALVCIFLYGGNDANNMLVPFDNADYMNYSILRGPLALPQSGLLQLASLPSFGLHSNCRKFGNSLIVALRQLLPTLAHWFSRLRRQTWPQNPISLRTSSVTPISSCSGKTQRGLRPRLQDGQVA
jgi:hypothetical protein